MTNYGPFQQIETFWQRVALAAGKDQLPVALRRAQAAADLGDKALAIASYRELLALREAALGAQDIKTIDAAWNLEGLLRKRGDLAASDELRTRYVTPLLQAQPSALDDDQKRMAKTIRDTEASEAQASVQKPIVR